MRLTKHSNNRLRQLHLFYPGHEVAVLSNTPHYTPPASSLKMMYDLATLPLWYGERDDIVLIRSNLAPPDHPFLPEEITPLLTLLSLDKPTDQLEALQSIPLEAAPWGLSQASIQCFQKASKLLPQLQLPTWDPHLHELIGRGTAIDALERLQQQLPHLLPSLALPRFCTTLEEVTQHIAESTPPFLFKRPYSCSGQGLLRIRSNTLTRSERQWIKGTLTRQCRISVEPLLEKTADFAMQFFSDGKGSITYEGLSLFHTDEKGAFLGCTLADQATLIHRLSQWVDAEHLETIRDAVIGILQHKVSHHYRGYLGIDMMIYHQEGSYHLHPFIEMNLRYTMGYVAIQIARQLLAPGTQGMFSILYHKEAGGAYRAHQEQRSDEPITIREGRISRGYLTLCPVTPESAYRAIVRIFDQCLDAEMQ